MGEVEEGAAALDVGAVEAFLARERPGLLAGELRSELISGGRSNLTYSLSDDVHRWVLRRPPLGHVLASAHDVGREFRVMHALGDSPVPVPVTVAHCPDPDVIGAPFYVMEFADGVILRDAAQLARQGPRDGTAVADALVDCLITLHSVDPASVGLEALGRPAGYLARQVRRWISQVAQSRSRDLDGLDDLGRRLGATVPTRGTSGIVHGDYRLDNVVLDPRLRHVVAVLDWEMATLGDPLTDVASLAVWWDGVAGLDSPVAAVPGEHEGFPASSYLLRCYAEATGTDVGRLDWYLGFAYFKLAAIFEGIYFRDQQGLTVGAGFDKIGSMTAPMIERGLAALATSSPEARPSCT